MNHEFDIAVIGMGLSGARVLVNLIDRLLQNPFPAKPLNIIAFDHGAEFGKGVPYGSRSDRQALLIETLKGTRCPAFSEWIDNNPQLIAKLQDSEHDCDRRWCRTNASALAEHRFDDVYLPRHLFGTFSAATLEQRIQTASALGLINITRKTEEVINLLPLSSGSYRLITDDNHYDSKHAIIAVGSIPRFDSFYRPSPLFHRCYVADQQFCGCFDLDVVVENHVTASPPNEINLVVVGAAASAVESIYRVVSDARISSRIASVTVISRSGLLPGGACDVTANKANVSPYALNRTSARDYVELTHYLQQQGRLKVIAAQVTAVSEDHDALRVVFSRTGLESQSVRANLVINCSGGGELMTTPSKLLRNLAQHLPTRENDRGFQMHDEYEMARWPNVWVIGPLLNHSALNSHVESINAVFQAAENLGERLYQEILLSTAATV